MGPFFRHHGWGFWNFSLMIFSLIFYLFLTRMVLHRLKNWGSGWVFIYIYDYIYMIIYDYIWLYMITHIYIYLYDLVYKSITLWLFVGPPWWGHRRRRGRRGRLAISHRCHSTPWMDGFPKSPVGRWAGRQLIPLFRPIIKVGTIGWCPPVM